MGPSMKHRSGVSLADRLETTPTRQQRSMTCSRSRAPVWDLLALDAYPGMSQASILKLVLGWRRP